jgi:hypothetical protein
MRNKPIFGLTKENLHLHYTVNEETGCWEWNRARNPAGYGHKGINGKVVNAHRYVYEMYNGKLAEGKVVCHKCDQPPCVNPDHLFEGTTKDNNNDARRKGRGYVLTKYSGEENGNAILTNNTVISMRNEYLNSDLTHAEIAKKYGVSSSVASNVLGRNSWKHLDDGYVNPRKSRWGKTPAKRAEKLVNEKKPLIQKSLFEGGLQSCK